MSSPVADKSPAYWGEYNNLQHVKHSLIRNYLNGWFPKLALGEHRPGRIVYIDTHAGRGRHRGGQSGSPLVALSTLLEHSSRESLLSRTQVLFVFIERDDESVRCLQSELETLQPFPANVDVHAVAGDGFQVIEQLVASLQGARLAPSFVFCDPFGFSIPGRLLRRLMSYPRVELFVNVMWRELDMAARQAEKPGMVARLDELFDGPEWREAITAEDFEERAEQCVQLFRRTVGAKWATYIRMLGENGRTRYFLLHLTNHEQGRELMKDCIWKTCPSGGYYARKADNPAWQFLITPEPNLAPLREWVVERLASGPRYWRALLLEVREEIWREPQLNEVIRQLRREGAIEADSYTKTFNPSNNPRLFLGGHQGGVG